MAEQAGANAPAQPQNQEPEAEFTLGEDGQVQIGGLFANELQGEGSEPEPEYSKPGGPTADEPEEPEEPAGEPKAEEPEEPKAEEEPEEGEDVEGEGEEEETDEPEEGEEKITVVDKDGEQKEVSLDELLAGKTFKVKAAGQEHEVSFEEMQRGYQRAADYHQKTTEIARQRDELMPYSSVVARLQADQDFVQHVQAYFTHGPAKPTEEEVSDEELTRLLDEDPERAKEVIAAQRKSKERRQKEQQVQQRQQELMQEWIQGEREKVKQEIPDFEKAAPDIAQTLADTYGFSQQEISQLYDHRLARMAYDAMQYHKGSSRSKSKNPPKGKPSAGPTTHNKLKDKKRAASPPRVARSGTPSPQPKPDAKIKESFERARQDGSTEAWVDHLMDRLT